MLAVFSSTLLEGCGGPHLPAAFFGLHLTRGVNSHTKLSKCYIANPVYESHLEVESTMVLTSCEILEIRNVGVGPCIHSSDVLAHLSFHL